VRLGSPAERIAGAYLRNAMLAAFNIRRGIGIRNSQKEKRD